MKYDKLKFITYCILFYSVTLYTNKSIGIPAIDTIAAIINQEIILESDVENIKKLYIKYQKNDFHINKDRAPLSRKDILDQLITDTLILQLAQRIKINISEEQLNQIIQHIATQNHMTKKEFKSYLTDSGIDYSTYINYIKKNALIDIICDYEMRHRIKILPYELKNLTTELILKNNNTEFQIDHILIPIEENAQESQIKQAYSLGIMLIKSIKNGINIKLLPKIYSKYEQNQSIKINRIKWSTIEELPTLFSENLTKHDIKINNVIGPIRSGIGFHILKIHNIYNNNIKKDIITKVHIRHIMLKTSKISNDQINKTKLLKIIEQIKNHHTTFSIEAKQISEDTDSSMYGGDLGWRYLEDFDKTLQPFLISLKKGEISSPIKTSDGWHLIELINIKNVDKNEILCKEHAKQILFNKKINEELKHWIQELKTSTYIKIFNHD